MAIELSGSRPGSAAYLGCYKKAIKTISEGLDEETKAKYRADAKKWTEQKPPPGEQQRYVHTSLSTIRESTKSHQGCLRSMGLAQSRTFLSPCTANMESGLPFWEGTVMPMVNRRSCCTYSKLLVSIHDLTIIAMTTIMSWVVGLPSKPGTKTGQGIQWSKTSQDGLPSPLVSVVHLATREAC